MSPPTDGGVGPRASTPLEELDPELPVLVEVVGEDAETGHTIIHDPDYLDPHGEYVETTLAEAIDTADDFCCDCFTRAMIDTAQDDSDSE